MKRIFLFALTILVATVAQASSEASYENDSTWTKVRIETTSAQVNVSDHDNSVQVDLEQILPNLCYRPGPLNTEIDLKNRRIVLSNYAFVQKDVLCAMIITPITRTVELGMLPSGNWELWITNARGERGRIENFFVRD